MVGDILYYDWAISGGTLMQVLDVYDPVASVRRVDDYMLAASIMHDDIGLLRPFGDMSLVLGATIKMSRSDILEFGDRVTLVSRRPLRIKASIISTR